MSKQICACKLIFDPSTKIMLLYENARYWLCLYKLAYNLRMSTAVHTGQLGCWMWTVLHRTRANLHRRRKKVFCTRNEPKKIEVNTRIICVTIEKAINHKSLKPNSTVLLGFSSKLPNAILDTPSKTGVPEVIPKNYVITKIMSIDLFEVFSFISYILSWKIHYTYIVRHLNMHTSKSSPHSK